MGREIQKRKNRSGIAKARRKPKTKKSLLQHPIIAANWDKSQTLEQNYQRLGLASKLNKHTGGREKKLEDVHRLRTARDEDVGLERKQDALAIASLRRPEQLNVAEAKVERDPKTGRIMKIVDSAEGPIKANPLNDPLNDIDSDVEDETLGQHADTMGVAESAQGETRSEVVARLEQEARRPAKKYKPKSSDNERAFIAELVGKYGEDYAAMARDLKINYMQRSEGDLKRRIKKWRESGGEVG
ncbi:hypothetical protein BAUCODRAFT_31538 [Baudoinia panamericana UAMH 10762]|uniref:Nucleolar protein 16 n=1 Tax=Baudoinia panamericana (strain UAMH 10762) TaxID=717646 RepID=M2N5A0_BAUPA|nr:uncharacterized protein BAUCODRAFT_31538 [Baudoinia panamericana UAMH 10762]EMC99203.1 hypothetical protein BAUCODRAFT_31538 [Baudoinia panamericana UAMH 10762]